MGINQEMARSIPSGGGGGLPPPPRTGKPIGVPEGYRVTRSGPFGDTGNLMGQGPRYNTGDEYIPSGWDDPQVAGLQSRLASAGLLRPGYRPGFFDNKTRSAFKTMLGYANQTGLSWEEWLGDAEAGRMGGPGGGGAGRRGPFKSVFVKKGFVPEQAYAPPDYDELRVKARQHVEDLIQRPLLEHEVVLLADRMLGASRRQYDAQLDNARKVHTAQQAMEEERARVAAGLGETPGPETALATGHAHERLPAQGIEEVNPEAEMVEFALRHFADRIRGIREAPYNERASQVTQGIMGKLSTLMGGQV